MATPYLMVSRDAQIALNEFSAQFDAALVSGEPGTWASTFGFTNSSRAIKTTYPIPVDAAGYKLREGDDKLRDLFERSLSMSPKEWQDGVRAHHLKIEAPDFVGWTGAPARMAQAAKRHPAKITAAMLKANPLLDLYRQELPGGSVASTKHLFDNTHPVNIFDSAFGTFDNDQTATLSSIEDWETMIKAAKLRFAQRLAPDGNPMGLVFDTLLVPAALGEQAKDFFESDTLVLAVENGGTIVGGVPRNNRHKGTVNLVVCPELLDADVIYPLDSKSGCSPWILQDGGAPEEIRYDKTSDLYKDSGFLAVKYILISAVAACLPHAIERIVIS